MTPRLWSMPAIGSVPGSGVIATRGLAEERTLRQRRVFGGEIHAIAGPGKIGFRRISVRVSRRDHGASQEIRPNAVLGGLMDTMAILDTDVLESTEVAARLGVSRSWVYEAAEEGRIPSVRLGGPDGPLRFLVPDVDTWLQRAHRGSPKPTTSSPAHCSSTHATRHSRTGSARRGTAAHHPRRGDSPLRRAQINLGEIASRPVKATIDGLCPLLGGRAAAAGTGASERCTSNAAHPTSSQAASR